MNSKILRSALKQNKTSLIIHGIIITSSIFAGVGLFGKLGKAGFALGIIGFIPLFTFSLLFMLITAYDVSNDIKIHNRVTKDRIKFMTTSTIPLTLGTVLIGIGLFGNKLDSNVKFIAGIVGFAALSFLALLTAVNCVKEIKQKYELKLEDANYKNGVKDQKQHAA